MQCIDLKVFLIILIALHVASSEGTTKNLKEIFIGRCHEFYSIVQLEETPRNCTLLWEKFHGAFASKNACHVKPKDYEDFFEYADDGKKLKKSIFWEATKDTVEVFTRTHPSFVALGNTLPGYIANNLFWCGGAGVDGINYTSCPTEKECGFEIYYPYWAYASKQFSKKVEGTVHVLLNGSRRDGIPTYSRESYFAKLELPFMNNKTVTELKIWVIYDLHNGQRERCGKNSLQLLFEDATKHGINSTCIDNPRILQPLMCNKYENAEVCKCPQGIRSAEATNNPLGLRYLSFALGCLLYGLFF